MMHGRFDKTSGKFSFDRAAKTGSTELSIDTASLTTGDNVKGNRPQSRDDHLKSADFFNVKEFPTMTFKSTKVTFAGELPSAVDGNAHAAGREQAGDADLRVASSAARTRSRRRTAAAATPSASFKRSDFGMKYAVPAVGDEITLNIEFEGDKE
jgi:polyisoprenoid-binding protein YceI